VSCERCGAVMRGARPVTIALCLWLLLTLPSTAARAQVQDPRCSQPYRLSTMGGSVVGRTIAADQYGYVHLLWMETDPADARLVVEYSRFDGRTWSTPVDVALASTAANIAFLSSSVDRNGTLHLLWVEGPGGPAFYTYAPANEANSAANWAKPWGIDLEGASEVVLQAGRDGTLHVLYARTSGEQQGIYYVNSKDRGVTLSDPVWLDPDMPDGSFPTGLNFRLDAVSGLHALWYYADLESPGNPGTWVRYAHSGDGGQTWSEPTTLARFAKDADDLEYPGPLLSVNGRTVLALWAGAWMQRTYSYSLDAGATWSAPQEFLKGLVGQAGDGIALDGDGRVHYLAQVRYPQGLYHAYWELDHWSAPSLIYLIARDSSDPMGARVHVHAVQAAVRLGNQLVASFVNDPSLPQHVMYAMQCAVGDVAPSSPLPTPEPVPPTVTQALVPPRGSTPSQPASSTVMPARDVPFGQSQGQVSTPGSPGSQLILGIAPCLFLLGSVLVARSLRMRR